MTNRTIRKQIFLNAAPEQVWEYLTQPEKLGLWFHRPETPLAEGEKLEMFGTESGDLLIWGEVKVADPPRRLEYSFTVKPMGDAVSLVKWSLEPVAGGTRLSLEHSGLPESADTFGLTLALDKGWDDHIARMRTSIHDMDG